MLLKMLFQNICLLINSQCEPVKLTGTFNLQHKSAAKILVIFLTGQFYILML